METVSSVGTKHCNGCETDRLLTCFDINRRAKDGKHTRCKVCRAAYREANRAELAAKERERQASDRERFRRISREYSAAHPEENKRRVALWKLANPQRWRDLRRRHKRRRKGMDAETVLYAEALLHDPCSYCGAQSKTIDHIVPVAHGGANHWSNLTASCFKCNQSKRTSPMLQWWLERRWIGWKPEAVQKQ